jgi:hypothetical protein
MSRVALARLLVAPLAGCAGVKATNGPSNHRDWSPDQALLSTADIKRSEVVVHNVRNCQYDDQDDYFVNYYDRTVRLEDLQSVDFILVPFQEMPSMAHTMLSFGTRDGQRIAVSVEIRKERGESYDAVKGLMNEFEIMYVVADEHDVLDLRAVQRGDDVYAYPLKMTPEQTQALFVSMMRRANRLAKHPEYYNTLTNNCTTAIVDHLNEVMPNTIALYNPKIVMPGLSDKFLYDSGLIATVQSFEETKRQANVSALARLHRADPNYSVAIRAARDGAGAAGASAGASLAGAATAAALPTARRSPPVPSALR